MRSAPSASCRGPVGAGLALGLLVVISVGACVPTGGAEEDDAAEVSARGEEAGFWAEYRSATAARAAGDRAAAIRGYEAALERRPEHGDSRYYVAQLRYGRGEVRAALDHLRRLAELEPRGLRAWQQLSVVSGTPRAGWLPDLATAAEAAREAIRLKPSESRSRLLLGRWAAYSGDRAVAVAELDAALGYNPDLQEATLLQGWLEAAAGDRGAAIDPVATLHDAASRVAEVRLAAGVPALRALELGDGSVALVLPGESGRETVLPASVPAPGWPERAEDGRDGEGAGPTPVPWRAVRLRGREGPELWIAGGGGRPLRRYLRQPSGAWEEAAAPGLPERLPGSVLAPIDLDGDGRDELFVANLLAGDPAIPEPPATGDMYGILLGADRSGAWVPRSGPMAGPWNAAAALDVDGDGDTDLILARDPGPESAPLPRRDDEVAAEPDPGVVLFRNDGGRLRAVEGMFPALSATVRDLRPLRLPAGAALYLATGGPAPERTAPDALWLRHDGRWIDDSARIGPGHPGGSLRAFPIGADALLLQHGGVVPADRAVWRIVRLGG